MSASTDISAPFVLRPYQTEAIEFLTRTPHALLALDTRLGKTLIALRAARAVQARRILVICPAIGRVSWAIEAPKCGSFALQVFSPSTGRPSFFAPDSLVVLAYDTLSRPGDTTALNLAGAPRWDVLILDEAQALKAWGSNRTRAVYGVIAPNCDRVWLLTGTPTPNHAGEMWPHVQALWPDAGLPASRHAFEDEFCKVEMTAFGRRIRGSRNQAKLREKLAPFVLRRRKADVFPDLPRMAHNMVPLDMGKQAIPADRMGDTLDAVLAASVVSPEADSLQHALGNAKAPAIIAWLDEQLSESMMDKVVVFAWHRSVLDALAEGLANYEPVRIDGATPDKARAAAIREFQHNPNCRVFIGQIKACGMAICLDAAADVAMAEPSWVPADNYQAACRIEDVSRSKAVTVSWLYAPDSLDQRIIAALRGKTREISQLWD